MKIVKVDIRSEGDVNADFSITYEDGTIKKGWSCDQGSIELTEENDQLADREVQELCFDLWTSMDIEEEDLYNENFAKFELTNDGWAMTESFSQDPE